MNSNYKTNMEIHTIEKYFYCEICELRFSLKSSLKRRLLTHSREKPFHCENWIQMFLKCRSQWTYTWGKPFQCELCGFNCSRNANLNRHMLTHTREKNFHWKICGFKCSHNTNLRKHMLTHTGEKHFQSAHLKSHLLAHTGENHSSVKSVDLCFPSFHLLKHMWTHIGEKSFHCEIWRMLFSIWEFQMPQDDTHW